MLEGLWTATFSSSMGGSGMGVAVLTNGKVLGGDAQYYYVGAYRISGQEFEAELRVIRFNQSGSSVFGPLKDFKLTLKGKTAPAVIEATGAVEGQPAATIGISLKKREEL